MFTEYITNPVLLQVGDSSLKITAWGAHILSWTNCDDQLLWMSNLSCMDGSAPIRGGIPIAFPQFANQGTLPLHGFARERLWRIVDQICLQDNSKKLVLELEDDEETRLLWDHPFKLRYSVVLSEDKLDLTFEVTNTSSSEPFTFTSCLHSYFRTPNIRLVRLKGLEGCTFIDKVSNFEEMVEHEELSIPKAGKSTVHSTKKLPNSNFTFISCENLLFY